MKNITVLTANLGGFDKQIDYVEQTVDYDFFRFTDKNFPPRLGSMTPRLQARIPKMSGWQMKPGYEYYVWVDASCILAKEDSLEWLINKCEDSDFVVFKHPNRNSIKEETDYLKERLEKKCPYITPRYENELIDEQVNIIKADENYIDDHFFASTVMVYKNTEKAHTALFDWWYHTSRYHSIDQLSLPYVLWRSDCDLTVIQESYLKTPYLKYIRK